MLVTITVTGSIEIEIVINKSLMTKLHRLVVGEREDLNGNLRLVVFSVSSPVSDDQKAERAVVFGGMGKSPKLRISKKDAA